MTATGTAATLALTLPWNDFEARLEIQVRRNDQGERVVMVLEGTEAAKAIRDALDVMIYGALETL